MVKSVIDFIGMIGTVVGVGVAVTVGFMICVVEDLLALVA